MFVVGHVDAITVSLEMGPAVAAQAAVKRDGAAGWRFIAGVRCLGHVTGRFREGQRGVVERVSFGNSCAGEGKRTWRKSAA